MVMEEKNLKTILEVSDLMRRYDQVYSRWAESRGFSTNAMSLMEELHIRPEGMEPAVIADYLGVPRQTMTSTLDSLERRGIIERRAHSTDRRRKVIRFTDAGREIADLLGQTLSCTKQRLVRGKQLLINKIEEEWAQDELQTNQRMDQACADRRS